MNTKHRLSAYAIAAALIVGVSYGVARSVDTSGAAGHGGHGTGHSEAGPLAPGAEGGLTSTKDGFVMAPSTSTLDSGPTEFSYRITGPDGRAVTSFEVEHDKRMHLIVVRDDTTGFQHLHPEMDPDGTWSLPLTVAGGTHRVFADFTPTGGSPMTLGADVAVAGDHVRVEHLPSRTASVDGFVVRLAGELVPGQASPLELTVHRNGQPVIDLQPYLAAYGHLVALRKVDLAYLHVHPEGSPGDGRTAAGPSINFVAEVPSAGLYRLFLDFQHEGVVRTAEFTVATSPTAPQQDQPVDHGADAGHSH